MTSSQRLTSTHDARRLLETAQILRSCAPKRALYLAQLAEDAAAEAQFEALRQACAAEAARAAALISARAGNPPLLRPATAGDLPTDRHGDLSSVAKELSL